MKRFRLFIAFVLVSLFAKAQTADTAKLIGLHPAVGKTISRDEKIKYHLFTLYDNNTFSTAQIFMYNDTTYLLKVAQTDGRMLQDTISNNQMDDFYGRIEEVEQQKVKDPEYAITTQENRDTYSRHQSAADINRMIGTLLTATLQTLYIISLFIQ